jgi:hypothetical protein
LLWRRSLSIRVPLVGLGQVLTSSGGMSWTRCPFGRSPPPTVALQGAVYPSSATPRRSAGSAHVSRKGRQPGPARPRQSPPTPTSPTRPPHTSAILRVLHQIRQRLPNDHIVIRIDFPAPGNAGRSPPPNTDHDARPAPRPGTARASHCRATRYHHAVRSYPCTGWLLESSRTVAKPRMTTTASGLASGVW